MITMRWRGGRQSSNVEDQRGRRGGGAGGGGGGLKFGLGGLVAIVAAYFLGIDPRVVLGLMQATGVGGGGGDLTATQEVDSAPPQDELGQFISTVLASTEDSWAAQFQAAGRTYEPPRLRFFTSRVQSGCGAAGAEMGPFYCPPDRRVYIDLGFFRELDQRFGAPGDFAQAYVIAHEVGHHVQNLLGIADRVRTGRQQARSEAESNQLQVRMELQADCLAGIWAHDSQRTQQWLEPGDIEEALRAAAAVGDDLIQKRTQGQVVPESFTHGSAAQRQRWFRTGFETGQVAACDTFATDRL